ncbi:hypothetical protein HO173_004770 [Letharia columbiana]|uniref:Uncharacterized protein n=1 Tax=Letharia columbiana TaxID=112416 RepID=A0A8H6L6H1_9LECA|nr:uncharacterized protein HO173_004770 [Letharia columbiana]KAF6237301.1 hypothetical protein HO173_004770 [Letharia columbiana]
MRLDLSGVALITGAGGSIDRACVLQFAHHGRTRIAGLATTASALSSLPAATAIVFLPLTGELLIHTPKV